MARYSYSRKPRGAARGRRSGGRASYGRTRLRSGARRGRSRSAAPRRTELVIRLEQPGAGSPLRNELTDALVSARGPGRNKSKF